MILFLGFEYFHESGATGFVNFGYSGANDPNFGFDSNILVSFHYYIINDFIIKTFHIWESMCLQKSTKS